MLLSKLAEIEQLRMKSGPLPSGAAPVTSSDAFKRRAAQSKPKSKTWDHRLSVEARVRCDSTLKTSSRNGATSSTIPLGTARPASQYYPWECFETRSSGFGFSKESCDAIPPGVMLCARGEESYDLGVAMNYGYAAGSPQLVRFFTEHVELIHNPPYADWETALTCGTTSALEMLFRMLCNRGDCVLTEEYTYSGAVEALNPLGVSSYGVKMDKAGLLPDELSSVLQEWDTTRGPKPTVLYTIPSGQNPTGVTQTRERRKAIYRVAEQHDLIIIEDDPYYFLQLGEDLCVSKTTMKCTVTAGEYIRRLSPSYLSFDTSGRVLRLDTASKILAPGLRVGWVSGCSQLVGKFLNHTEFSTTSPSGPSQIMMSKLLDENWGHVGFINWLMYLSSQYSQRLRTMLEACTMHLPPKLCRWIVPVSGMFLWIQVDWRNHPLVPQQGMSGAVDASRLQVEDSIYAHARQRGVQISKGSWFATKTHLQAQMYFRLTFAAAPEESLEEAIARFGMALRAEFSLDDKVQSELASRTPLMRHICVGA